MLGGSSSEIDVLGGPKGPSWSYPAREFPTVRCMYVYNVLYIIYNIYMHISTTKKFFIIYIYIYIMGMDYPITCIYQYISHSYSTWSQWEVSCSHSKPLCQSKPSRTRYYSEAQNKPNTEILSTWSIAIPSSWIIVLSHILGRFTICPELQPVYIHSYPHHNPYFHSIQNGCIPIKTIMFIRHPH